MSIYLYWIDRYAYMGINRKIFYSVQLKTYSQYNITCKSCLNTNCYWYYHSPRDWPTSFPTLEEDSARFDTYFLHLCFAPGVSQMWSGLTADRQGLAHYLPYFGRKLSNIWYIIPSLVMAFCIWSQVSFNQLLICSLPKQPLRNCY